VGFPGSSQQDGYWGHFLTLQCKSSILVLFCAEIAPVVKMEQENWQSQFLRLQKHMSLFAYDQ
jgi:hypothetical protein